MIKKSSAMQTFKARLQTCLERHDRYAAMVRVLNADSPNVCNEHYGIETATYTNAAWVINELAMKYWGKASQMAKDTGYKQPRTMLFPEALQDLRNFVKEL